MVALARGDLVAAHDHLVVALRSRMGHGFHGRACDTLNAIAVRCALGGEPVTAARLFGAAQATRARHAVPPRASSARTGREQQAALRAVLGDAAFDDAYGEGAELGLDEAAALALDVEHPDLAADSTRFSTGLSATNAPPSRPTPTATQPPEPNAPDPPRHPSDTRAAVDHEVIAATRRAERQ